MSGSLGKITALLAAPSETVASPELVSLINSNVNPPTEVSADDVYIRAMYVVSDEVNSFGGRFGTNEHKRLCELLVDAPLLVGHRKESLPIGRNFHAVQVQRDGVNWVKCYFYWLKNADGAENLRENIDGGIYKECSIGFTFLFPECSVCGLDMRSCEHQPLCSYQVDGSDTVAHFCYRQIERVLETSLVYRGANPDTAVTRDLADRRGRSTAIVLGSLSDLDSSSQYLVTPYYDGIELMLQVGFGRATIERLDGQAWDDSITERFDLGTVPELHGCYGQLVGYRGKERCTVAELEQYLDSQSGPVSRVELKVLFPQGVEQPSKANSNKVERVGALRYQIVEVDRIGLVAQRLMTRQGVRLWSLNESPMRSSGYRYCPEPVSSSTAGEYSLERNGVDGLLSLQLDTRTELYRIRQFNLNRLLRGGRFVTDRLKVSEHYRTDPKSAGVVKGTVTELTDDGQGMILQTIGGLSGQFHVRPIRLGGKKRFLFYRVGC